MGASHDMCQSNIQTRVSISSNIGAEDMDISMQGSRDPDNKPVHS